MAKARAEAIARKDREERQRVEAETRPDGQKPAAESDEPAKTKERKAKKRENARERKKRKEGQQKTEAKEALAVQVNGALPGKAKEDVLEEMGFSSDSDE